MTQKGLKDELDLTGNQPASDRLALVLDLLEDEATLSTQIGVCLELAEYTVLLVAKDPGKARRQGCWLR